MKNTPGHPDQESPRASSESVLCYKDSEEKLLPGSVSTMFDCNGNLILPKGTIENFREEMKKMKHPGRKKTGVLVVCTKCGHEWERMTRKAGDVRCHPCGQRIKLEALE
jgi:DNA-directed RNA polymerase subunit RPC12/RpoP